VFGSIGNYTVYGRFSDDTLVALFIYTLLMDTGALIGQGLTFCRTFCSRGPDGKWQRFLKASALPFNAAGPTRAYVQEQRDEVAKREAEGRKVLAAALAYRNPTGAPRRYVGGDDALHFYVRDNREEAPHVIIYRPKLGRAIWMTTNLSTKRTFFHSGSGPLAMPTEEA
jgi:hypothetical protein